MLFGGGLMAVHGSELIKFEGAGPLAIVFAAFSANHFW
jgi:solute carrier family 9B (sodium/hydrogen exchanger), member 1/2